MRARLLRVLLVPANTAPILIGVCTAVQAAAVNQIQSTQFRARSWVTITASDGTSVQVQVRANGILIYPTTTWVNGEIVRLTGTNHQDVSYMEYYKLGDYVAPSVAVNCSETGATLAVSNERKITFKATDASTGVVLASRTLEPISGPPGTSNASLYDWQPNPINDSFTFAELGVAPGTTVNFTATDEALNDSGVSSCVDPAAPVETTAAPTETTAAPTETTAAPSETTAAPSETTVAPTETTAAPSETTTAPTETTAAPSETTVKPTETTEAAKPSETTSSPATNLPNTGSHSTALFATAGGILIAGAVVLMTATRRRQH